jgi:hypothetical protein
MKERPILFNGAMVRAILEGRKTQTRRVIKVQPESNEFGISRVVESSKKGDEGKYFWSISDATGFKKRSSLFNSPFGNVGDRLYVREAFAIVPRTAYAMSDGVQQTINPDDPYNAAIYRAGWERSAPRWMPSIHMPRWASRITLEITDIKVQQLLDISTYDAKAEGFTGDMAQYWFISTCRDIYGEADIDQNVWVWVIEFKRVGS